MTRGVANAESREASDHTSPTLLERLRRQPDPGSWEQLVRLYTPLLQLWLRRHSIPDADADDLTQEVFSVLLCKLPEFEYDPQRGSFRGWLRTILAKCLQSRWRSLKSLPRAVGGSELDPALAALADPHSDLSRQWNAEHDRHVLRHLLGMIRVDFASSTWEAFRRAALDGARAREVAEELGISINAVLIAKSRVLRRLRAELAALTGDCRLS